ncbi:hypothetical protein [Streptomyces sp. TR02-1]|uniref:hypothetical protein n=1 Tax=Streptomyces sp. TR02-1 TaxID=3385977 RepID=UPI0039A1506A
MIEKHFTFGDIGLVLPHPGPGYLTSAKAEDGASRKHAAAGVRLTDDTPLWWSSCPGTELLGQALEASAHGPVELCPEGSGEDDAGLALAVAEHLAQHRGPGAVVGPCCLAPPAPLPTGTVRLPHLVRSTATSQDHLPVWELLPAEAAQAWLGGPIRQRDLDFFEQHLEQLLGLKRRSSTDGGPEELSRLLTGRYLSIRFVLQHAELVRTLITTSGSSR